MSRGGRWNNGRSDDRRASSAPVLSPFAFPALAPVFAQITDEIGGGDYKWELATVTGRQPPGPPGGKCRELNLKTGVANNTFVFLVRFAGVWYFQATSTGGGGGASPFFGDGSDGPAHLDGSAPAVGGPDYLGNYIFTQNSANAADTSTVNGFGVYYTHRTPLLALLNIDPAVILMSGNHLGGFPIASLVVTGAGAISTNPEYLDGSGGHSTIATPNQGGFAGSGSFGGSWGTKGASGGTGPGSQSFSFVSVPVPGAGGNGSFGKGGKGGDNGANAGGLARDPVASEVARRARFFGGPYTAPGNDVSSSYLFGVRFPSGAGGGSGAGDGVSNGAAGGQGAGWADLYFADASGFTGQVDSTGSRGLDATAGNPNGAGGGGGGGGLQRTWVDPEKTPTKTWTTTDSGGLGGAGRGTGGNGDQGGSGLILGTYA